MKGHKCTSCDTILERDEILVDVISDPYCTGDSPSEEEWTCPKCHSDSIEDIWICDMCEEREAGDGIDECEECWKILEEEEAA